MRAIVFAVPRADDRAVLRATSVDALRAYLSAGGIAYTDVDLGARLLVGDQIVMTVTASQQPTHVVTYTRVEISSQQTDDRSPTAYRVETVDYLGGNDYRLTAKLSGVQTALLRSGRITAELCRCSLADSVPSTTPEPIRVQATTETTVLSIPGGVDALVPVIGVVRKPTTITGTTVPTWTTLNAIDVPAEQVLPSVVYLALWDGSGWMNGRRANAELTRYLTDAGQNVQYVKSVQYIPVSLLDPEIGDLAVRMYNTGSGFLAEIKTGTVRLLATNHNPSAGQDNRKAYYSGQYVVYNRGVQVGVCSGAYSLGSGTAIYAELSLGDAGLQARLIMRQSSTADLYIPIAIPATAVILSAWTSKEQEAERNAWIALIGGALGGAYRGAAAGPAGALTGAASGLSSAVGSSVEEVVHVAADAARHDVVAGSSGAAYGFAAAPYILVTWRHAQDEATARNYYRAHGYACQLVTIGLPQTREHYNAYAGRLRYSETRDASSGFSPVSIGQIQTAANEELGDGVIVYDEALYVGNYLTYAN